MFSKEDVSIHELNYYKNYHFRNERKLWETKGISMHRKVFDYLCVNKNPEFQKIVMNYFLILHLANHYNWSSLDKFELARENPIFLKLVYESVLPSYTENYCLWFPCFPCFECEDGFDSIESLIACSMYTKEESTLFQNISLSEYEYYLNVLFQYYELYDGRMPNILYTYLRESNNKEIQKLFLEWYIPCLESLLGVYKHPKTDFLETTKEIRPSIKKFYDAESLHDLKEFFCEK